MSIIICILFHSETGNTRAMADLVEEGIKQADNEGEITTHIFEIREVGDEEFTILDKAQAILLGSPTYLGDLSWQMKKFLDTLPQRDINFEGKIAAAFASAGAPGGGGYEEAILTMLKSLLVIGCLVYSGGVNKGNSRLHFGAVSNKEPQGIDADRCRTLGANVAQKVIELFRT